MRTRIITFPTAVEALAFAQGIDYVNDSAIDVTVTGCLVTITDDDYDDESEV